MQRREWEADPESIRTRLGDLTMPLFVKPARAGSSVGVSRVTSLIDLDGAMAEAFAEDSRVLIEAGCPGREVEVAVLAAPTLVVTSHGTGGVAATCRSRASSMAYFTPAPTTLSGKSLPNTRW